MNSEQKIIAKKNIIYGCNRGSISHGTYTGESDDIDRLFIYIAPLENYLGFEKYETFEEKINEYDDVYYELRHFIKLISACNPNIVISLWVAPEDKLKETIYSDVLINNRDKFISKLVYKTFCGYAHDQMKKMEGTGKYLGYMGEKRKALVEKFGFDPKHSSHLLRLLAMGIEILGLGYPIVKRPDAEYFIKIKNGEYSLDHIKKAAEEAFLNIEEQYKKTTLPDLPDYKYIENMLMEMLKSFHHLETIPTHRR